MIKIFKQKKSVKWVSVLTSFSLLFSGCTTVVSRTPRSNIIVGKEIPGTERFEIKNLAVNRVADCERDIFKVDFDALRIVMVNRTEESWTELDRQRFYAIAFKDSEYSIGTDYVEFCTPIYTYFTLGIPLLIAALDWRKDSEIGPPLRAAYGFMLVPGIHTLLMMEGISETKSTRRKLKTIEPGPRTEIVSGLDGDLVLQLVDTAGRPCWESSRNSDGTFTVPVRAYLESTIGEENFHMRLESSSVKILGKNDFHFPYSLSALVSRYVDSVGKADNSSETSIHFSDSLEIVSGPEGRVEWDVVRAGMTGIFNVAVSTSGNKNCYKVKSSINKISGALALGIPEEIILIKPRKESIVKIPFSLPVTAEDGTAVFELTAEDAFGRKSEPARFEIPYVHRELPQLQIVNVDLNPCANETDTFDLAVSVRNKGKGPAEDVALKIDGVPNIGKVITSPAHIEKIDPYTRQTAKFRLQLPANGSAKELKLKLVASERFGVGDVKKEVILPIVSPDML